MAGVPSSDARGVTLLRPFLASAETFKSTIEEWRSVAA
jgi:hypothetical protein